MDSREGIIRVDPRAPHVLIDYIIWNFGCVHGKSNW